MADYAVRRADLDRDRDAVVAVWSRNLRSHDGPGHAARYDWYYRQNPLGPGRLWVVEAGPGGPVVGTAGLGLRRLITPGGTVLAGLASDFAVDADHRSLGPAVMLQRAVLGTVGDGVDLIYALPNARALPVYKLLRYGADAALARYVKVLAVGRYLSRAPGPRVAKRVAAGLADPLLRLASPETWRPTRGRAVREVAGFDARFDELWARTAPASDVAGERTSAFLGWRYGLCPVAAYATLGLTDRGGDRLLGYAVCTRGADRQVNVIDLWPAAAAAVRDDLLAGLLRWARAGGAASVACETAGARQVADGLARFGFRHRGAGSAIVVSAARAGATQPALATWHFLRADEDYD